MALALVALWIAALPGIAAEPPHDAFNRGVIMTGSDGNASAGLVAQAGQPTSAGAPPVEDAQPAGTAAPDSPGAGSEEDDRDAWMGVPPTPFDIGERGAPSFSRKPPGPPGQVAEEADFFQAFSEGLDFQGFGADFRDVDWRQTLEFVNAARTEYAPERNEIRMEGDVHVRVDRLHFRADSFHYNQDTGEILAEGDVTLRTEKSLLSASRVEYLMPADAKLRMPGEEPPLTTEEPADAESAREQMQQGRLKATDVYLVEPGRELRADAIDFDFAKRGGTLTKPRGLVVSEIEGRPVGLYYGAEIIEVVDETTARGEELWVSPCGGDPPSVSVLLDEARYTEDEAFVAKGARLKIGGVKTPIYWPKWTYRLGARRTLGFDFDSGRAAELGYYVNYAQYFAAGRDVDLGVRLYPTEKEGVGVGVEGSYDFMRSPAHPLFRSEGYYRLLGTTKNSGEATLYHRHELAQDTLLLLQWEQWFERDYMKEWWYDLYRDRTQPRTFANVTYTQPGYIATATARVTTNDFVAETERLPEATFHLLERPLFDGVYLTFDSVGGYNEREPAGTEAARLMNVARLTLDIDAHEALSITPFAEAELGYYSRTLDEGDDDFFSATTVGVTAQTRFHKAYPGRWGFSGFKHVIVPSLTYSYRPEPTTGIDEVPRFDAYDNAFGRSRLETKIDSLVFGRDARSNLSWQVMRLTLYQGTDFWNELRDAEDYELEFDLRPRPWWGVQLVAERHRASQDVDLDAPFFFQRRFLEFLEDLVNRPVDPELRFRYNARYADYDRVLGYFYYDDRIYQGRFNARIGFAYTETRETVFNREILYGGGYRLSEDWSVAFEHRYDFERDELYRQEYEVRRRWKCWETALKFRDRTEGWDVSFEMSLVAFPGTTLTF